MDFPKLFNEATDAGRVPVSWGPPGPRWNIKKVLCGWGGRRVCASTLQLPGGLRGRREAVVVQLPDVFLQVEVAAEALAAGGAGEGLLVVVRVHVEGEVVHLVERLAADRTLELLLPAVRQLVVLVVSCTESEDDKSEHTLTQLVQFYRKIINDVCILHQWLQTFLSTGPLKQSHVTGCRLLYWNTS